jgi:hypothetical protein
MPGVRDADRQGPGADDLAPGLGDRARAVLATGP